MFRNSKRPKRTIPCKHRQPPAFEELQPRYLMAGDIDVSFGGNGFGIATVDHGGLDIMRDTASQSDGKIVAAGVSTFGGGGENFALARFHTDGTLDTSFGGAGVADGITVTDFDQREDQAMDVFILPDQKILVAGYSENDQTEETFASLARYHSDGLLDETFGAGGRVSIDIGENDYRHTAIGGGRIVLVTSDELFGLEMDGTLAGAFGGDGIIGEADLALPAEQTFYDIDYGDGKFVIGTHTGNATARVIRMDPNGILDASFGANGFAEFTDLSPNAYVQRVMVAHDGDVVGAITDPNEDVKWIFRLTDQGVLDGNFHANGVHETPAALDFDPKDLVEMFNGSIVALGNSYANDDPNVAILRLSETGAADQSFGSEGWASYDLNVHVTGQTAEVYANGNIIVGGSTLGTNSDFAMLRVDGTNALPQIDWSGGFGTPKLPPNNPWNGEQPGRPIKTIEAMHGAGQAGKRLEQVEPTTAPERIRDLAIPTHRAASRTEPHALAVDQLFAELDISRLKSFW